MLCSQQKSILHLRILASATVVVHLLKALLSDRGATVNFEFHWSYQEVLSADKATDDKCFSSIITNCLQQSNLLQHSDLSSSLSRGCRIQICCPVVANTHFNWAFSITDINYVWLPHSSHSIFCTITFFIFFVWWCSLYSAIQLTAARLCIKYCFCSCSSVYLTAFCSYL